MTVKCQELEKIIRMFNDKSTVAKEARVSVETPDGTMWDIQKIFLNETKLKVKTIVKNTDDLDIDGKNLKPDEEDNLINSSNKKEEIKDEIEINNSEKNNDNLELDLIETESLDTNKLHLLIESIDSFNDN